MAEASTRGPQVPRRARLGADRRRHRHARASPGTRRSSSARSCSSTRRRSARTVDEGPAVRRGRVGQGGVGRDRAAVAARSPRSTRRWATRPEQINEDPYGEGWMVKIRLSNAVRGGRPAWTRRLRGHPATLDEPLHLRHRRTTAARCSTPSASSRSTSCSPPSRRACGSAARSTSRPASPSRRSTRACATSPPATCPTEDELSFLGAGMYDHYVPSADRLDPAALASS